MNAKRATATVALLLASPAAFAEGSDQLTGQWLIRSTTMFVDVLDHTSEDVTFEVQGRVTVATPAGRIVGSFGDGETFDPTENGPHQLTYSQDQRTGWDVAVSGAAGEGRVWSTDWVLDGRDYDPAKGVDASFFALVDATGDGGTGVVEMQLQGWSGYRWHAVATSTGVDNTELRSTPNYLAAYRPEIPLYLHAPSVADHEVGTPTASNLSFDFDEEAEQGGVFRFNVGQAGTWHIVCDANEDGVADISDNGDLAFTGWAEAAGDRYLTWDGYDRDGDLVIRLTSCALTGALGEVHFLSDDIETAFPGMRIYEVDGSGDRTPLAMFWNDTDVADYDVPMPDGELAAVSSGPEGMLPNAYDDDATANVGARSWGNFNDEGKGDEAVLATWSHLAISDPDVIEMDYDLDPPHPEDEPEVIEEGLEIALPEGFRGGYYLGGCSTPAGVAAPLMAMLIGGLGAGLRRRED